MMSLATPKPARPVPSTGPASQRTRIRPSALRVLEQAERERESERESERQLELPPVEELAAIFEDDEDMATIRRDLPLMQPRRLEVEVDDADATLKRPVRTQFTSEVNGAFVGLAIPTVDDEHAVEWDRSEVEPTVRRPLSEMAGELGVGPASDPQPLLLVRRSNRPPPAPARHALARAKRNDRRRLLQGILLFALVFVAVTLLTAVIVRLVSH
ncbi:MAG: hypothetical protein IPJ34_22840 [Myxococcales bacterium]|nr:hypothetical protein [Myxococcales bacterium]